MNIPLIPQKKPDKRQHKMVIIGPPNSGKSTLIHRLIYERFNSKVYSTIGAFFQIWDVTDNIKLECWDTAGQERFRALVPMYYRNANLALIIYDVTDYDSLIHAKGWYNEIIKKEPECRIILIGSKLDLTDRYNVGFTDVERRFRADIPHIQLSSKTGTNVGRCVDMIIKEVMEIPIRKEQKTQAIDLESHPNSAYDSYLPNCNDSSCIIC